MDNGTVTTRNLPALLLLCAGLFFPLERAWAQEDEQRPDLWRVLVDVTYNGSSGNQNLSFFDGGFRVTRLETDVAEFELNARARTGTDNGDRVAESYRSSLKVDAFPEERWSPFAFASAERDRFRRLDLRTNTGGGVKYTFLRQEDSEVSVSLAVLHAREDFDGPESPAVDGRLSWRLKGRHELRDGVVAEHMSFYQPVWDRADDYLLQSETVLAVQVFSLLAVTATYVYERDSTPPVDVLPDDHQVKVGIQLQL